jgi:hypothetical protein
MIDAAFIQHVDWQMAHLQPMCEVRQRIQVALAGMGGIATTL